jgi:hypothetical protein
MTEEKKEEKTLLTDEQLNEVVGGAGDARRPDWLKD